MRGGTRCILADGADTALELIGTRRCRTRCGQSGFTASCASLACCPISGPYATSTRSTNLPRGVRLAAYGGEAGDLPPQLLQVFLDQAAAGTAVVPIGNVFRFDEIVEAHRAMEDGRLTGSWW